MKRYGLWFVIGLLYTTSASAQIKTEISSFLHSVELKSVTDTTRVNQWVAPLRIQMPLLNGQFKVQNAFMVTHQTGVIDDGVWGIMDTHIQGRWGIGQHAILSLHASLPTGKRSLDTADANLINTVARNDLNFPVRTIGQGFDFGGTLSVARQRGHWSMSAGLRAVRKGGYTPIEGALTYKPGDEITGLAGIDYSYKQWIFQINTAASFYKVDRQNGAIVFRNGKQMLLHTGIFYVGRILRMQAELIEIARLKNLNVSDIGHLLYELRDSNGNDLRARFEISLTPIRQITLFATGYAKHLTANAHPQGTPLYQGDSHLFEGGGGISFSFGTNTLSLRATQMTGKTADNTVELSAFNFRAAFSFSL